MVLNLELPGEFLGSQMPGTAIVLRRRDNTGADQRTPDFILSEVMACWPFSPELTELLEDHILVAEAAQETRELIRILASSYRERGEAVPIITPADFFVDDDACGVQSLLDSIVPVGEQNKIKDLEFRISRRNNLTDLRKRARVVDAVRRNPIRGNNG